MKISIIVDGKFHTKTIEVPEASDGTSSVNYIENIYNSMQVIDNENIEGFLYQDNGNTVFYGNPSLDISVWVELHNLVAILDNPDFLKYHMEFNNSKMMFKKSPLMEIYSFEEFLPLDSDTRVRKFLNFMVNTIKVGFMYDLQLNPVLSITNSNGKILDSSGRTIPINKFLQDYLTRMIDYCKNYLGNAEFANVVKSMVDATEPGSEPTQPTQNIVIPSELKNYLIDLHSAWVMIINELNGDIPNSGQVNELFSHNYRFSTSFNELGINDWYTAITGDKIPEDKIPEVILSTKRDLSGYVEEYIANIKAIDNFMTDIYKTHSDYDIIEAKFYNPSYPFDNYGINEVAMIVEHWGNGLM